MILLILLSLRRLLRKLTTASVYCLLQAVGFLGLGTVKSPFRVVWIQPDRIKQRLEKRPPALYFRFFKFRHRKVGKIIGGDWDKRVRPFDKEYDLYLGYRKHFLNKLKWEETEFFQRVKKQIEAEGFDKWGCTSLEDFKERLASLDLMFEDMKRQGYKSQREIGNFFSRSFDEINVCVSRDGELILFEGRNRLSMAKVLGLEQVPVLVMGCHKSYYEAMKNKTGKRRLSASELLDEPEKNTFLE